jgi:hypothetical protein
MKRITFLALLISLIATCASAKNLKPASGSSSFLDEVVSVYVEISHDGATWEKKEDYKLWCGKDYDTRIELANDHFKAGLKNERRNLTIVGNATDAAYKIEVDITNLARKQGSGMWGSCYIKLYGTITVTDTSTNEEVCKVDVDGISGDTDFVENDRIAKAFYGLARKFGKMKE